MFARQAEERRQSLEEEEALASQETQKGSNIPEFTQHLMNLLEERTPREHWDADLRTTLTNQLIAFLEQSTSVDPNYLVKQYEDYLQQLTTAQNTRLRAKYGTNKVDMLKESGVIRKIIMKIPEVAQETFENYQYNPDKRESQDPVFAEAEYEEDVGEVEVEAQQTSTPKRPGSTIAPPEAKMAARPDSMASYRNPKQEVIPSEAQLRGYSEGTEEMEDDQLQMALKLSAQEVHRDPTETPNTGGSAASSSPSGIAGVQPQQSPGTPTLKTTEELAIAQANFRRVLGELSELQDKIRGVNCTQEDLDRMEILQPQMIAFRKQIGILEQSQAMSSEGTQPKGVTAKRRTDDQGVRERGAKHRTMGATHKGTTKEKSQSKYDNIADVFQKGVEEVVSSEPSSATKTPTSIPVTFQESTSRLPTEQEAMQISGSPATSQVSSPTDPRSAVLASDIRSKIGKKTGQSP